MPQAFSNLGSNEQDLSLPVRIDPYTPSDCHRAKVYATVAIFGNGSKGEDAEYSSESRVDLLRGIHVSLALELPCRYQRVELKGLDAIGCAPYGVQIRCNYCPSKY